MIAMMRAEFYRLLHTGLTYAYLAAVLLSSAINTFSVSSLFDISTMQQEQGGLSILGIVATTGVTIFNVVLSCLFCVVFSARVYKKGYLKSLLQMPSGRINYGVTQLVVSMIVVLITFVGSTLAVVAIAVACGFSFVTADIVSVLAWIVECVIVTTSLSMMSLLLLHTIRIEVLAAIGALLFSTGLLRVLLQHCIRSAVDGISNDSTLANYFSGWLAAFPSGVIGTLHGGVIVECASIGVSVSLLLLCAVLTLAVLRWKDIC